VASLKKGMASAVVVAVTTIIGLIIVFASVLGGFAMAGGPFGVLVQPSELVVIGGAAIGTLVISAPGKVGKRILGSFKKAFSGKPPGKADFLDLLKCLFQIFQAMRREGVVALEAHVQDPHKSTIFKQFPTVLGSSSTAARPPSSHSSSTRRWKLITTKSISRST
jgi:chemotaxis protein MotA